MSYENIESPGNPIYKCNFDKWPEKYIPKNENIRPVNTFPNIKIIFRNINSGIATKIKASLYDKIGNIIQKYINQTGATGKFTYLGQEIKNLSLSIKEIGIENDHTIFVFNN